MENNYFKCTYEKYMKYIYYLFYEVSRSINYHGTCVKSSKTQKHNDFNPKIINFNQNFKKFS